MAEPLKVLASLIRWRWGRHNPQPLPVEILERLPLGVLGDQELANCTRVPVEEIRATRERLGCPSSRELYLRARGIALEDAVLRALVREPRTISRIHAAIVQDYGSVTDRQVRRVVHSLESRGFVERRKIIVDNPRRGAVLVNAWRRPSSTSGKRRVA